MQISKAINFFGYPGQNKEFDIYLTSVGIVERPVFEENPMEWISRNDEGFIFIFNEKHSYEETWGAPKEDGEMIFCTIRAYGKNNTDNFSEYKGDLPGGLTFKSTLDEAKANFGPPDASRMSMKNQAVCNWNKLNNIALSIVFLEHGQGIAFLNIKPEAI